MNRNEEYAEILRELNAMPVPEGSVERALAKRKQHRKKTLLRVVGGVAAVLALFVVLVNVSPAIAQALEKVPGLGGIVIQLRRSPSLEEAAIRGYAQPIGVTETSGDVTYHVDYMLADDEGVSVFFSVESAVDLENATFVCQVSDGKAPVFGVSTGRTVSAVKTLSGEGDNQYCAKAIFEAGTPETFQMRIGLQPKTGWNPSDAITLELTPDPEKTVQTISTDLNETFRVYGQTLTVKRLEIGLHQMTVFVEEAEGNDYELAGLLFYAVTADGHHLDMPYDILYPGWKDDGGDQCFYLESPIFYDCSQMTLYVTRADWKIPGKDKAYINLEEGTAEGLPETVTLMETIKTENGWKVVLRSDNNDMGGKSFAVNWCFDDPDVPVYGGNLTPEVREHKKAIAWETERTGEVNLKAEDNEEGYSFTTLILDDYPGTETWIITAADYTWRDKENPIVVSLPMPQE